MSSMLAKGVETHRNTCVIKKQTQQTQWFKKCTCTCKLIVTN